MLKYSFSLYGISIFLSIGIIVAVFVPYSPSLLPSISLAFIAILLCCIEKPLLRSMGCFLAGMSITFIYSWITISHWLPAEMEDKEIKITGVIADFPRKSERGWQFDFYPDHLGGKIRLSLLEQSGKDIIPDFACRYQLLVKLKRPRGLLNFDQFDYQAWLLQAGYTATGYIRAVNQCERIKPATILSLRSDIAQWINSVKISDYAKSTLLGLLIGSYADIDIFQWQVLRDSGTIHLLSVSGLHIVLIAGLVHFIVRRMVCFLVFPLRWLPAEYWGGFAALSCAIFYALLAGFSVATQRSLIMVGVAVIQKFMYGRFVFGTVFLVSFLLVIVVNPLSILSAGFWFSYWATAVLMISSYGYCNVSSGSKIRFVVDSVWLQRLVFLLMAPVLLAVYGRVPLLSLPLNLLAVPWVSFLSLPLGFAALLVLPVSQHCAEYLLNLASWTLDVYWYVMQLGVTIGKSWQFQMGGISLVSLLLAITGLCMLMVLPAGLPLRICGVLLCLPLFWPQEMGLSDSEAEVTVLDVGQGLAVIVQTARHVLVYDTGDRSSERFDAGRDIVAPALRNLRDKKIDMLMISHSDSDHAGGRHGLLGEFSATQFWSGTPEKLVSDEHTFYPCRAGMQWRWDGVTFKVLHPNLMALMSGNSRSCVLLIDAGSRRMLLTGDIESAAEQQLLRSGSDIRADVLLAPHHGSKTSSTPAFLEAVQPETVVVSSGYRNRFHHPAAQVSDRYREMGFSVLNTAETGAIRIRFSPKERSIHTALCKQRFFWRIERYNAHCQLS